MNKVRAAIEQAGIRVSLSEVTMLPKNYVPVDADGASKLARLTEALEEHDDVQNVYANADMPEELVGKGSE
jgi:transcriptional/translational regulatory protein YebC/TACO1